MRHWLAAIGLMSACANPPASTGDEFIIPHHQPSGVIVSGPRLGVLTIVGDCLYIGTHSDRVLAVWPPGTRLVGGYLSVPTANGVMRRFRVGDRVSFNGSPVSLSLLAGEARALVQRCRGELFSIEYLED